MKKILTAIIILAFVILAYTGAYMYSLSKVELRDIKIENLQNIDRRGFNLLGSIELYNGGITSIDIEKVEYEIILTSKNMLLGNGTIIGGKIKPKDIAKFGFNQQINWIPTAEIADELISNDKVEIKVRGNAYLNSFGLYQTKIPFEKDKDIKPYLKQFVGTEIDNAADKINEILNSDAAKKIAERIKGYI